MSFRILSAGFYSALALTATSAMASQIPLGSDLRDIARFRPDSMPDAQTIVSDIENDAQKYIPEGTQDTQILGTLALQSEPTMNGDETIYGDVTAMMSSQSKGDFVRRYSISVASINGGRLVQQVKFSDTPLSELHFQIDAGLISREVAVEDPENHILMIYPIGVGGIDPAVADPSKTSLMTPMFKNATLRRASAIQHRSYPAYYRNLQFMPITTERGNQTDIAFHISIIYSDQDWKTKGGNYLVRGFDSHGCMRLRQKDLNELYTILMKGGTANIPVNVGYFVYNRGSDGHREEGNGILENVGAYPVFGPYYQVVKNYAAPGEPPMPHRDDKEHLLDMAKIYHSPDPVLQQLDGLEDTEKRDLMLFEELVKEANFGPLEPVKPKLASSTKPVHKG